MAAVFERFTERARAAVALATEEAYASGRGAGPEHLLVGLAREGAGVAAVLLEGAGLSEAELRRALRLPVPPEEPPPDRAAAFSHEGAAVLREAARVAGERGAAQVATEHLLLALVRVASAAPVGRLLAGAGIDEPGIGAGLARLAHAPPVAPPPSPSVEPRTLVAIVCPACGEGQLELVGGDVRTGRAPLSVDARGLAACPACGSPWEVGYSVTWRPLPET